MSLHDFSIPFVVFPDGERFPMLVDAMGSPNWYSTLFATTQIRNASQAANTIHAALSSVRHLFAWAEQKTVDIEARFASREFLTVSEIESLTAYAQRRASEKEQSVGAAIQLRVSPNRVGSRFNPPMRRVSLKTQYNRLSCMARYLEWFAIYVLERESRSVDADTLKSVKLMGDRIRSKRPRKRKSTVNAKKGLSKESQNELRNITCVGSEKNPFTVAVQSRNELIVHLFALGLRSGELLALQVSDFDFQKNEVLVARRHDDKNDPRARQPVAKTRDRLLPMTESLSRKVYEYVIKARRNFPAARRHKFLLVTHQAGPYQGAPLSAKGLGKIFSVIKSANSDALRGLSPHVLRHTANDELSELMDEAQVRAVDEEKMRSYMMGWREGSGTAATYTRRHTQKKAREASLQLQQRVEGKNASE